MLFISGIFCPKTNPKGIIAGTIASQIFLVIKIIGNGLFELGLGQFFVEFNA
jgi:hypothetical protein